MIARYLVMRTIRRNAWLITGVAAVLVLLVAA